MKSRFARFALCLMVPFLAPRPTSSATASASFGVSVTVLASCAVSASATTLTTHTIRNATEAVSVTCSHPVPYSITLGTEPANRSLTPADPVVSAPAWSHNPALHDLPNPNSLKSVSRVWTGNDDTLAGSASRPSPTLVRSGPSSTAKYTASSSYADTITITITY